MTDTAVPATRMGLGLFTISVTILALEVLHVRILSVQMWYHHAFIIVTMAMFLGRGTQGMTRGVNMLGLIVAVTSTVVVGLMLIMP